MNHSESKANNAPETDDEVAYIAVMGPTGTGKTSFINILSGSDLRTGNELESCTQEVQVSKIFEIDGRWLALIDTPGFDDTNLSDTNVLSQIAAYLASSYDNGKQLAGVLYMHRILDNGIGGISTRNFRMFRSLCGGQTMRNVLITTTMWDQVDEAVGEEREAELATKEIFFKPAIDKGARLARHTNTHASANSIIRRILEGDPSSVTLQIQDELNGGLEISETQAGMELRRGLLEQMDKHQQELRGIVAEFHAAVRVRDEESQKELAQERSRIEIAISQLQTESRNLVQVYKDALSKLEERLRVAEAAATARKTASQGGSTAGLDQTHSPVIQAVAATENSHAALEGNLAAAIPIVGFWGKLAIMLTPFSLTWK